MQMGRSYEPLAAGKAPDTALLPRHVRRAVFAVVGTLLAFAAYLLIVRGPALFLDLAHMTANMLCL
jgi:hypothetical protein